MHKTVESRRHRELWCATIKSVVVVWVLLIGLPIAVVATVQSHNEDPNERYAERNENEAAKVLLAKANDAYSKGDFQTASKGYQNLLEQGYGSADLHYNLGNAYYRLDKIPEAILHYEKAYKLSPGDEDIQVNLRFANQKITDKIETVPEFFLTKWWRGLIMAFSLQTWSIMAVLMFVIGFSLLGIYLFVQTALMKRVSFYTGIMVLALSLLTLFIAGRQHSYLSSNQQGIVFNGAVHVKGAPGTGQKTLFVIHEGTKVRINARENDWIEIILPNGHIGWIEAAAVREI